MTAMIEPGEPAPDFTLPDQDGRPLALRDLRGRRVVLYFYPKDDTPGCTKQACGLRDEYSAFEERGAVILGVSPDSEASHEKFKTKYELPFTLLADPDHKVAEAYGAWGEKKMYGKTSQGIIRSTFVIDAEGKIAKVMPGVKPEGHAERVLAALGWEAAKLGAG